ncbi:cation channel sperm-associated auxiliary subunit TMEM249-like [Cetorhinus maximus]
MLEKLTRSNSICGEKNRVYVSSPYDSSSDSFSRVTCRLHQDNIQFAGFFMFLILVGLWLIITSIGRRSLIVDLNEDAYKFYIHHYLQHEGPLDEIYIRLTTQKSGQGKFFYKLILNGTYIEVLSLTGIKFSTNPEKLEKLGMRLAAKLNLNYFDCVDLSSKHVIRHWPLDKAKDTRRRTKGLISYV